jgi:hypothetical protein
VDHTGANLAEIDPHLLSVLVRVLLIELLIVKSDFCRIQRCGNDADSLFLYKFPSLFNKIFTPLHTLTQLWRLIFSPVRIKEVFALNLLGRTHLLVSFFQNFYVRFARSAYLRNLFGHSCYIDAFPLPISNVLVNSLLFLDALTIFNKLILKFILNQTIQHRSSYDIVASRHFITHASASKQLAHDCLRSLVPLSLQLFVSDAIEEHIRIFYCAGATALYNLKVAFSRPYPLSDFVIKSSVKLRNS